MCEATQTARDIVGSCPREQWKHRHAFWSNDRDQFWLDPVHGSYAASGAGSQPMWGSPSLDLVVVQSPRLWQNQAEKDTGLLEPVPTRADEQGRRGQSHCVSVPQYNKE